MRLRIKSCTAGVSFSLHITKSSCAVEPLVIRHVKPRGVTYEILNPSFDDHFCCLEILPGIILEIAGCFSIANSSFSKSGRI